MEDEFKALKFTALLLLAILLALLAIAMPEKVLAI
jgi:hypothetical protein